MRLLMIKYGNIVLTTTITLLTLYHLYLLLLVLQVRLGGYIVNLSDFYSYRLIGKLTAFAASGVQLAQTDRDHPIRIPISEYSKTFFFSPCFKLVPGEYPREKEKNMDLERI